MKKQYTNKKTENNTEKQNDIAIVKIVNIDNDLDIIKLVKRLNTDMSDITIDSVMYNILFYMEKRIPLWKILDELQISDSLYAMLCLDNQLFQACIDKLKQQFSDRLKDKTLSSYDIASDNIKMFIVKSQHPEFRDNYLPQMQGISNITINLDGIGGLNIKAGLIEQEPLKDITE
jgi:hypothetical protein